MSGENKNIQSHSRAGDWGDSWDINVFANDYAKFKEIVNGMQPGKVDAAAAAFHSVGERLDTTIEALYREAGRLADTWGGEDAEAAMKQFRKAYEQAYEIRDKAYQTSRALTAHANWQRDWQDSLKDGFVADSGWVNAIPAVGQGMAMGRNAAADDLMEKLQEQTVQSNENFPDTIRADMPRTGPDDTPNYAGGPGGPGSPDLPGGPGDLPKGPDGPGDIPGGPKGPDTGETDFPTGGPGSGGSSLAGMGGGGGGAPGGLGAGGGMPGGGMPGGPAGGGPGTSAGGSGFGGPAGLGKGMPMGGMPMGMGGGQGGSKEEERERTTWLTEDEDVWGGGDDAAPSVID